MPAARDVVIQAGGECLGLMNFCGSGELEKRFKFVRGSENVIT